MYEYNVSLQANRICYGQSMASISRSIVPPLVPRSLLRDDTRLPSPVIVGNCLNAIPISRVFSCVKGMDVRVDIEASPLLPDVHSSDILRIPVL